MILALLFLGDISHHAPQNVPQVKDYRQDEQQDPHADGEQNPLDHEVEAVEVPVEHFIRRGWGDTPESIQPIGQGLYALSHQERQQDMSQQQNTVKR